MAGQKVMRGHWMRYRMIVVRVLIITINLSMRSKQKLQVHHDFNHKHLTDSVSTDIKYMIQNRSGGP